MKTYAFAFIALLFSFVWFGCDKDEGVSDVTEGVSKDVGVSDVTSDVLDEQGPKTLTKKQACLLWVDAFCDTSSHCKIYDTKEACLTEYDGYCNDASTDYYTEAEQEKFYQCLDGLASLPAEKCDEFKAYGDQIITACQ